MCLYLETDGLPADWDLKRGLAGDDNTRPEKRGFFGGVGGMDGWVRDSSAKTKRKKTKTKKKTTVHLTTLVEQKR